MKVSQSLIKNYFRYLDKKECGLQLKAKYFDGIEFPESEAALKGKYLEFLCTGEPDRNGKFPEAPVLKTGANKGKPTAEFERLFKQAENFQRALKRYDVEVLEKNYKLAYEDYEGIADILAAFGPDGENVIIDIKSTGLLYNKWDEYGWEESSLEYKPHLLMQAVHYPWLALKSMGEQMRFQYWVFSTSNEIDFELFEIKLEEGTMERWELKLATLREQMKLENAMGWDPLPSVTRCAACPLKTTCTHFVDVPEVKTIYLPSNNF